MRRRTQRSIHTLEVLHPIRHLTHTHNVIHPPPFSGTAQIGDSAFANCTSLASIVLPNVHSLGELTFAGCTALRTISNPASGQGANAFQGCPCPELSYFGSVFNCTQVTDATTFSCGTDRIYGFCGPHQGPGAGLPLAQCLGQCGTSSGYSCSGAQCVESNITGGVSLAECEAACLPPSKLYLCLPEGECVESIEPDRGVSLEQCINTCTK